MYLIGSILMAVVLLGGLVLTFRLAEPEHGRSYLRSSDVSVVYALALLFMLSCFGQIPAAARANHVKEGIVGVVADTNGVDPVVLTIQTETTQYDIPCGPEQKACQFARKGDLVQFDATNSATGWGDPKREIRFVTLGANSQPR